VKPLDYLYITDLAAEATGFSFNHVALDMGYDISMTYTFKETLTFYSVLLAIGTIYRIIACALLILVKRSKQR
jgi:hypothetical protein